MDEWFRERLRFAREKAERKVEDFYVDPRGFGTLRPLRSELRVMKYASPRRNKEEHVKDLVELWLSRDAKFIAMPGTEPPDFFASNFKKIIGVEAISFHEDMHGFEVSHESLKMYADQIYFVIAMWITPEVHMQLYYDFDVSDDLKAHICNRDHYEPFVLTKAEMWARKGKSKRGSRYGRSIPRTPEKWEAKGWEPFRRAWDKLGE